MLKTRNNLPSLPGALVAAALIGFGVTANAQELPALTTYDDFEDRMLNKEDWIGGVVHSAANELRRQQARGLLITGLRGFSNRGDNARDKARNSLFIVEELAAGVNTLKFKARVNQARVSSCADGGNTNRVKLRTGGFFFNTGGAAYCGDRTGDVWAQVWIGRIEDTNLSSNYFNVSGGVKVCTDETCSTEDSVYYRQFGIIKAADFANIGVHWDEQNGRFVFQHKKDTYEFDYNGILTNAGPPSGEYQKGIQTTADIEDCLRADGREPFGFINGAVDNIKVNADFAEAATLATPRCE